MQRLYEIFIGLRHLRSRKRTGFLSAITGIAIGAVALGVAALIVLISVMDGFEAELKDKIFGTNAHGVVLKYGRDFAEYPEVTRTIAAVDGVVGASPFILNECMVSSDSSLTGMLLKGIDPNTTSGVTRIDEYLRSGSLGLLSSWDQQLAEGETADERGTKLLPGILLGTELAESLGVGLGDVVNTVSPLGDIGPTGPIPRSKAFRVAGVYHSGMYEYDSKFGYVTLASAQDFFDLGDIITGIELRLVDVDQTKPIIARVVDSLEGYPYRAKDWTQLNKNLFSALRLQKLVMFLLLTIIVFVASFLILVTLIMLVLDKQKEIAILKSIGVSDSGVLRIFVFEGTMIGVVGTLFGVVLGLLLCLLVRAWGFGLDASVYYIERLPVVLDPLTFSVIAAVALAMSFFATLYPAFRAARMPPVEGLRYQ